MSESITLTIDGQSITVPVGTTILDAAAQLGIEIPVICYHPHLTGNGLCRVCSVDAGGRVQAAACISECGNGMDVQTKSDDVIRGRRTILEMLASTVNLENAPEIEALLASTRRNLSGLKGGRRGKRPFMTTIPFSPAIITSALTAGDACKCVATMPNTPLLSVLMDAALIRPSAPL